MAAPPPAGHQPMAATLSARGLSKTGFGYYSVALATLHSGKTKWFKPGRITPERLEEVLRLKLYNRTKG